ncbi:30S ribosome-binding factor RbfA [Spiroplasma platyhelix]|uniref:Ribosome-binding factor A n=1 Tax=Spiroplasma platyhelix PALS-1 TaxID=1276218 RepID=A0A846TRU9_9MOLU|nr:30S ribosome-binding factor RbfA [Spiroplasma platyhelix]MBE4703852.1 Ribosome-binding factor A [Spiroplasma platyhelix PALS-1]NKE38225.1 30S ribosome-binding factor RbfA [Spiroplasma platyhelix PALS-1]UJB29110.1 ribosome-binding factor A [Spiroplasma platyhelix PALS-1]
MANQKIARTEKWMKIEITNILKIKAKNPKFSDITITDVKLTNDLSYATITWYLYNQDQSKIKEISQELENVKGFCRRELAQISSAYKVPQLRFKYDQTIEEADRIESILNKLKEEK